MKNIAGEHGVPVFQPENVNTAEGVAGLQAFRPELLVVAAYGQILSREVLAVAPRGGVNVHASLLPKYRGAAPVAWAIYHGEKQTGVTLIRMSVALDAGDMLAQEVIDILPDETAGEVEARLAQLGARMTLDVLDKLARGPVEGVKQDRGLVTKAPKLKKEDGLIDWARTAEQACNQVRAMQPWPTAYTFLHRDGHAPQRVLITRAVPAPCPSSPARPAPGTIEPTSNLELIVWAGDNPVQVQELQPAGKRRMAAEEFMRGYRPKAGDHFGPEAP
jgi:methionyl-tRNA formyltransferase